MMPSTTRFGGGTSTGFHSRVVWSDYDLFDVDNDQTHFAWVQYGDIDTMTAVFSHEIAEEIGDWIATAAAEHGVRH